MNALRSLAALFILALAAGLPVHAVEGGPTSAVVSSEEPAEAAAADPQAVILEIQVAGRLGTRTIQAAPKVAVRNGSAATVTIESDDAERPFRLDIETTPTIREKRRIHVAMEVRLEAGQQSITRRFDFVTLDGEALKVEDADPEAQRELKVTVTPRISE